MDARLAGKILETSLGVTRPTLLGAGREGFVFGQGTRAYKVFVNAKGWQSPARREFLFRALGARDDPPERILPILDLHEIDDALVIVSPWIHGTPYEGGHWRDLVGLLRECRVRGVGLTNIHPDNILVSSAGIVFIDLGESVVELTESIFDQMVKRAFLSFRWPLRTDLRDLMRRSLAEDPPELDGYGLLALESKAWNTSVTPSADLTPRARAGPVTLLIKTGAMEWSTIEFQVNHIVKQLGGSTRFQEILAATDSHLGPFARAYGHADIKAHREALGRLVRAELIDRIVVLPDSPSERRAISQRWFGLDAVDPRSANGEPTLMTLQGFDACETDLVLQLDSDVLLHCGSGVDPLERLMAGLVAHPEALAISPPPVLGSPQKLSLRGPKGNWRVEVRCSLLDLRRLRALLPLPNRLTPSRRLELSWHRSLDTRLASGSGAALRGGGVDFSMIHVPNTAKASQNRWFNFLKAVERGQLNPDQSGRIDLWDDLRGWLGSRREELVFVVRGRDVDPPRLERCLLSLRIQQDQSFGVLFIDAGSTNGMAERIESLCGAELRERSSIYRNWNAAPALENLFRAIHELIDRPETIVALLDADDALLTPAAVGVVTAAYRAGADLTVGSMLRTDRPATYDVDFENPRGRRGGNVWQHMRTFRRSLLEQLREDDLKVDGEWVPYAWDWALMLPLVELAEHPVWIKEPLYLHDPRVETRPFTVPERERMIARICQKGSRAPPASLRVPG